MDRVNGTIVLKDNPSGIDNLDILREILNYLIDKYGVVVDEEAMQNPYELFVMDADSVFFTLPVSDIKNVVASVSNFRVLSGKNNDEKQDRAINDFFRFFDSHEENLPKVNEYAEQLIEKVCNFPKSEKALIRSKINKRLVNDKKVYLDYFRDLR